MVFLLFTFLLAVTSANGAGHCAVDDEACEFWLTVGARKTMWRGFNEKAYINNTDCRPFIYNNEGAIPLDDVIMADGTDTNRLLMVVNGTLPGPTLTMYVDQEITVHVTNHLIDAIITIHWHGLIVRGRPWMDGAAFITQCPILPGQTFTYKFIADRIGTHFYHAHSGGKITNGLFGPLIVKAKTTDLYEEHLITVQDYDNSKGNTEIAFEVNYGIVSPSGMPFFGYPTFDGIQTTVVSLTSTLINGRGRVYDSNGNQLTCVPWPVFEVQQGQSYRFRVINAAYALQTMLSIDNHTLSVMSFDGHDIDPLNVDKVFSHSGERVDFILNANQTIGNYWIRLETLIPGRFPAYAILRYKTATVEDPASKAKECTAASTCTWANCPFESYSHVSCVNVEHMKSANTASMAPSANPPGGGTFREVFMNFGFGLLNGEFTGHVNGVSFEPPAVSALTQSNDVTNKCSEEHNCGVDKVCKCISSLNIQLGDVLQLNILNMGSNAIVHHPIHTHGYSYHVLKVGYRPTNDSFADFGQNPDVTCNSNNPLTVCNNASWSNSSWSNGNIPGVDLSRAPLRDNLVIPAGGYAVVRFVADNPGLWFIHCHQVWHVNQFGMGMLINDSFADVPPPPAGFPECGDFRYLPEEPPVSSTTTQSSTSGSTSSSTDTRCPIISDCDDEEMFTRAEFWGTFGGMLLVILLQFIITVGCMARRGKKGYKL